MKKHLTLPTRWLLCLSLAWGAWGDLQAPRAAQAASQFDLNGPAGSGAFGTQVIALPNGNLVVTDPLYDAGPVIDVGAVYLYRGDSGALISLFTGTVISDQVGSGGVALLSNGNYVVRSPVWDNGPAVDAGAVTWCNGATGMTGVVSTTNSLVGSHSNDSIGGEGVFEVGQSNYVVLSSFWDNGTIANVGAATWADGRRGISGAITSANSLIGNSANEYTGYEAGLTVLPDGNYLVRSPGWNNGPATDAGAITWANGNSGLSGVITLTNSLVGSHTNDQVGANRITVLGNGNYVVATRQWDNGPILDAGAVTWANGQVGLHGPITTSNSLVGTTAEDYVGIMVTALTNGNYVVGSSNWDNGPLVDAGAATWANGTTGLTGSVTISNSLVGIQDYDQVGSEGVTALRNGHYVVASTSWHHGTINEAGAVTWGNGAGGTTGVVTVTNSLVGTQLSDLVGSDGVTALANGNYVVTSRLWDNGVIANAGAATWGDGTVGITGAVTTTNSLVGSRAEDQVGGGDGSVALPSGNYLVCSPEWDNGSIVNAGAVTWGNGATGATGPVTITNSLVGSHVSDNVGTERIVVLDNGNFVIPSPSWDSLSLANVGAVTWVSENGGTAGPISPANSLIGSTAGDQVGYNGGVIGLTNGNYLVVTQRWNNGSATSAGAVTWGNGSSGLTGVVSTTNSLVGSTTMDQLGRGRVLALPNGGYVVLSTDWDNGPLANAGAVTLGAGNGQTIGPLTSANSVRGEVADGGTSLTFAYDPMHSQLVVGRPRENKVTLFTLLSEHVYLPAVRR